MNIYSKKVQMNELINGALGYFELYLLNIMVS